MLTLKNRMETALRTGLEDVASELYNMVRIELNINEFSKKLILFLDSMPVVAENTKHVFDLLEQDLVLFLKVNTQVVYNMCTQTNEEDFKKLFTSTLIYTNIGVKQNKPRMVKNELEPVVLPKRGRPKKQKEADLKSLL